MLMGETYPNIEEEASYKPQPIPREKYYTVLTSQPQRRLGFGSTSPIEYEEPIPDYPGPGKYNPTLPASHYESIRGKGTGFTSKVKRKLQFTMGNSNPPPGAYTVKPVDHRIKPTIRKITTRSRCSCYPQENSFSTPGPGEYNIAPKSNRAITSVFKSKVPRLYQGRPQQKFDGRYITINCV